jgi:hypothetical protein
MIYLLLAVSLTLNIVFVWYIRKILSKFWYDVEARDSFVNMLTQYEEALQSVYKLEEFYGEETIKKAIQQTRFVVKACEEFKEILEKGSIEEAESLTEEGSQEAGEEVGEEDEDTKKESVIRLKEGEKVSQDASSYKRVVREQV